MRELYQVRNKHLHPVGSCDVARIKGKVNALNGFKFHRHLAKQELCPIYQVLTSHCGEELG